MKLVIPITPTAQMRDRIGTITFADGTTQARSYKDNKQRKRENVLAAFLSRRQPAQPMSGPVLLGVKVYIAPPKSKPTWFDGTAAEWRRYATHGLIRPPVKPDLDNYVKQIKDCLTECEFWGDDKQVVGYMPGIGKYYTADRPRWEIEIVPYDWRKGVPAYGAAARPEPLSLLRGA